MLDVVSTLFEIVTVVTAVAVLARRAPLGPDDIVERRLEELRQEHPTLVRPPDARAAP